MIENNLKDTITPTFEMKKSNGFLICESCKGYYQLQDDESPDDFSRCECGGSLEYRENIDDLKVPPIIDTDNDIDIGEEPNEYDDEYEELQQIVDFLKIKATERKKFLENLSQRVASQEELLNEIRYEKFKDINSENQSIWDILEEKNFDNQINGQKEVINSIMDNEDRFLSLLHEKRSKPKGISEKVNTSSLAKIGVIVLIIVIVIILMFILI